jgi:hypothetical protein
MPTARRVLGAAATIAAGTVLTACQKPVPDVTVLSGSETTVVHPQSYCFDAKHCRFPKSEVGGVSAQAGSTLLVDVPRAVAYAFWSVTSATQLGDGTFQTIKGQAYSSGAVHNSHSTRVAVPYGVGTYYLVVTQLSTSGNGSWVAEVTITR